MTGLAKCLPRALRPLAQRGKASARSSLVPLHQGNRLTTNRAVLTSESRLTAKVTANRSDSCRSGATSADRYRPSTCTDGQRRTGRKELEFAGHSPARARVCPAGDQQRDRRLPRRRAAENAGDTNREHLRRPSWQAWLYTSGGHGSGGVGGGATAAEAPGKTAAGTTPPAEVRGRARFPTGPRDSMQGRACGGRRTPSRATTSTGSIRLPATDDLVRAGRRDGVQASSMPASLSFLFVLSRGLGDVSLHLRPALRAAACGGRPRPANHSRYGGPSWNSTSATANAKRRPDKQDRRHNKHKLLKRPDTLAGQQHEVDQHEEPDDHQEDGTYQRVHGAILTGRSGAGTPSLVGYIRHCRAPSALANEARVALDGPRPSPELVATAATPEQVRPHRPCPRCALPWAALGPRTIRDHRSAADNHGQRHRRSTGTVALSDHPVRLPPLRRS
jgi:hypothetical protein